MIGTITTQEHLKPTTLQTLEYVWCKETPDQILSSLSPHISRILVQRDQGLFLDMMKFASSLLSTLYDIISKPGLISQFTDRFLAATHLASNKYFNKEDFDQHRYLDCVSAILSVWIDSTDMQDESLVWRRLMVYLRRSDLHLLDTILQTNNISVSVIERVLSSIKTLPNMELYLKYVVCSRRATHRSQYTMFAMSHQPTSQDFSNWTIRKNLTAIRSISEFTKTSKYDDVILECLCSSFYTLPPRPDFETVNTDLIQPEASADVMFFIDRGEASETPSTDNIKDESVVISQEKGVVTGNVSECKNVCDIKNVTDKEKQEETTTESLQLVEEPCIKIKNQRKRKNRLLPSTKEVLVIKTSTAETTEPMITETINITETRNISEIREVPDNKISTEKINLTEDTLAALPDSSAGLRSSRRRRQSNTSETSVESIASRTRNRLKPHLANITEEINEAKSKSVKKAKTPAAKVKTPATTKKTKSKVRKVSESVMEETPQIPVSRTRSRKIVI